MAQIEAVLSRRRLVWGLCSLHNEKRSGSVGPPPQSIYQRNPPRRLASFAPRSAPPIRPIVPPIPPQLPALSFAAGTPNGRWAASGCRFPSSLAHDTPTIRLGSRSEEDRPTRSWWSPPRIPAGRRLTCADMDATLLPQRRTCSAMTGASSASRRRNATAFVSRPRVRFWIVRYLVMPRPLTRYRDAVASGS